MTNYNTFLVIYAINFIVVTVNFVEHKLMYNSLLVLLASIINVNCYSNYKRDLFVNTILAIVNYTLYQNNFNELKILYIEYLFALLVLFNSFLVMLKFAIYRDHFNSLNKTNTAIYKLWIDSLNNIKYNNSSDSNSDSNSDNESIESNNTVMDEFCMDELVNPLSQSKCNSKKRTRSYSESDLNKKLFNKHETVQLDNSPVDFVLFPNLETIDNANKLKKD